MYTLLLTIPSILVFTIYYLGGGDFVRPRELADTFLVSVVLTIFAIYAFTGSELTPEFKETIITAIEATYKEVE